VIGNDVIDLQLAAVQSDWQRPGFREKVFTAGENCLIDQSEQPFQLVWRLWSMKESAYKAYHRMHPKRFFNPKKMECTITGQDTGQVQVAEQIFKTHTKITQESVCTSAVQDESKGFSAEIFTIPTSANESLFSHQKLKAYCVKNWSISRSDLQVEKTNQGVPRLRDDSNNQTRAISISHHGRYGAFIIQE